MADAMPFQDRRDAGRQLAALMRQRKFDKQVVVLGLPRGGVPVAYEVATALGAPLDVFLVRKLGVPDHEELAMGAIATGGIQVLNDEVVSQLHLSKSEIESVAHDELRELRRREQDYRDDLPLPILRDRHVILVDDGLATGASMRAAIEAVKAQGPAGILVGVPVGASEVCAEIARSVDDVVCVKTPPDLYGVGWWYRDFEPTTDNEVRDLLHAARVGGNEGGQDQSASEAATRGNTRRAG